MRMFVRSTRCLSTSSTWPMRCRMESSSSSPTKDLLFIERPNVVVQMKEIIRIIFRFDRGQALEVRTVRGGGLLRGFGADVVDVDAALPSPQRAVQLTEPGERIAS